MRAGRLLVAVLLLVGMFIRGAPVAYASSVSGLSVTASTYKVNATADYTVSFTPTNPLAVGDVITIQFPNSYNLTNTTVQFPCGTSTESSGIVRIVVTGSCSPVSVLFVGVINPAVEQDYWFVVKTSSDPDAVNAKVTVIGPVKQFAITGCNSPAESGQEYTIEAVAQDMNHTWDNTYTGTTLLGPLNPGDIAPTEVIFDHGVAKFKVTFGAATTLPNTGPKRTIQLTDKTDPTIQGSLTNITVNPGPLASMKLTGTTSVVTGHEGLFYAEPADAFGNLRGDGFPYPSTPTIGGLDASDWVTETPVLETKLGNPTFRAQFGKVGTRSLTLTVGSVVSNAVVVNVMDVPPIPPPPPVVIVVPQPAPEVLARVEVIPGGAQSVQAGESLVFQARGISNYGKVMPGLTFNWIATGVGNVDSAGVFRSEKAGTAAVTATSNGLPGTAGPITVTPGPAVELAVTGPDTVRSGYTADYVASGTDRFGNLVPNPAVVWSVEGAGGTGQINGQGTLTGGKAGEVTVVATLGTLRATKAVTVLAGDPASLRIDPTAITIKVTQTVHFVAEVKDRSGNVITDPPIAWKVDRLGIQTDHLFRATGDGIATVTATLGSLTATARITIKPLIPPDVIVTPSPGASIEGREVEEPVPPAPGHEFASSVVTLQVDPPPFGLKFDEGRVLPENTWVCHYCESVKSWVFFPTYRSGNLLSASLWDSGIYALVSVNQYPSFADTKDHWGERAILGMASRGVLSGYPDGTFLPNMGIRRDEFVKILVGALGTCPKLDLSALDRYVDKAEIPDWAKPYVAAATELGLVNGYEDNTFRPAGVISRAEVAAILSRLLGLRPEFAPMVTFTPQPYTDSIPTWAAAYIDRVSSAGVFQGFPDSTFRPADSTTRAQIATVFFRMIGRYGGEVVQ